MGGKQLVDNSLPNSSSIFKGSSATRAARIIKTGLCRIISLQPTFRRRNVLIRIIRWIWRGFRRA